MAVYYVRTDGNDANSGTGSSTSQAWKTINYALGSTSGFASGDTLWIAPGTYRESIAVGMTNPTATTYIKGDPTASQFSGITAGKVRLTNFLTNDISAASDVHILNLQLKNYFDISNIYFDNGATGSFHSIVVGTTAGASRYVTVTDCWFYGDKNIRSTGNMPFGTILDLSIERCIFTGAGPTFNFLRGTGANYGLNITIKSCISMQGNMLVVNNSGTGANSYIGPITIYNCTALAGGVSIGTVVNPWTTQAVVRNCCFFGSFFGGNTTVIDENYNFAQARSNTTLGANSLTGMVGMEFYQNKKFGGSERLFGTPLSGSAIVGAGSSTFAPAGGDVFGRSFASPPSMGAIEAYPITSTGGLIVHPGMTGGIRG